MLRYDTQRQHATVRFGEISSAFLRAIDDFRASYVLRFTPEAVPAPGWHELGVRVTRPGTRYTVRARKGYHAQ